MKVTSLALDPIEKKPLARFHPGSKILSVGSMGCTMHCPWCQNHEIAQPQNASLLPYREMGSIELADTAENFVTRGNVGLAYTYNEPLLHWKEVLDCADEIKGRNLLNVVVTNGLISQDKLRILLPYIDAFNIDLKGFDQSVYDICGGALETVMQTIVLAAEHSHVEVTTLIIPGLNDTIGLIEKEAAWLAGIDSDITLHLTRFFPQFLFLDCGATPLTTMHAAETAARKHLKHVYLGNI